jgi:hypothetical protein
MRPGTIAPIGESINILTGSWSQVRQIGRFTIKESGSYTPIQRSILNSRPSIELLTTSTDLSDIFGNVLNFNNWPSMFFNESFPLFSQQPLGTELGIRYKFSDNAIGNITTYPGSSTNSTKQLAVKPLVSSDPLGGFQLYIPPTDNIDLEISFKISSFYVVPSPNIQVAVFTSDVISTYTGLETNYLYKFSSNTSLVDHAVKFTVSNINGLYIVFYALSPNSGTIYIDDISVISLFKKSDIQDFQKGSMQHISSLNQTYGGAKLTGPAVNVNSNQTVDGGPVVKITKVNPNQLTFADKQITTIDQTISGIKTRKVTDSTNTNIGGTI